MPRDSIRRMDVDTQWVYHRKMRQLQRLYPVDWPSFAVAYLCLLGEAWRGRSRDISLEDAWCPSVPVAYEVALEALAAVKLIDADGQIPEESWGDWYAPVEQRISDAEARGRHAALVRWHGGPVAPAMPEHASTMPGVTHAIPQPSVPTVPPVIPPPPTGGGKRRDGTNPRANGTSPRQTGDSPRDAGTSVRQERIAQKRGPSSLHQILTANNERRTP